MSDEVPAGRLPFVVNAPGKAILFGEHAVVHGRTAIVLALDARTEVAFRGQAGGTRTVYNGSTEVPRANPYLQEALSRHPSVGPLDLMTRSGLPQASGLGSSAAFTVSLTAGLLALEGGAPRLRLAEESFRTERGAQGVGSPVDTSAAVAGGVLAVGAKTFGDRLWELPGTDGTPLWSVARMPDPGWTWVVGFTGVAKDTATVVRRVGERLRAPDGPQLLDQIESVSSRGARALLARDRGEVGALMNENQRALLELGISHPRLEALLRSVGEHALGAKITGAGGGGSVLVLPKEGEEVLAGRAISRAGGVPFLLRVAATGATLVPAGEGPRARGAAPASRAS